MNDQIFVINNEKKLVELNETEFISENELQELLENYPNLISGSQINPDNPRKWLFISREFGVPDESKGSNKWSLDHLFIDQDGIPTLVEVKRSSDTRIRREVVGQMLDYASNAVTYWSIDEIKNKFFEYCKIHNIEPAIKLLELDIEDANRFWEIVETNLQAGKIRMLFIADKIPKELQRIIEFLNEQMSPAEVLGIEIKQYGSKELKTLVPRVIGKTSMAQVKKGQRKSNKWDEKSFFEELEKNNGIEIRDIARKLLTHFEYRVTEIWYGVGKKIGSLVPILKINGVNHFIFSLWTEGSIEIPFQWMKNKKAFADIEMRRKVLDGLNQLEGVHIKEEKIDKRPWFYMKVLKNKDNYKKFVSLMDWMLDAYEKRCC